MRRPVCILRPARMGFGEIWPTEICENWIFQLCQRGLKVSIVREPRRGRMYIPPHFAETREAELHRIIRAYPLGILITGGPDGLDANHIPFELDASSSPHGTLRGHVARANPVWQQASRGLEVLVVFRGADGYISPNWYP